MIKTTLHNWQTKKLGEVCDFYNGLWKGKEPPYIEVGVIRNTNFTKDGILDDSDIAYLGVEKKQYEKRKLVYGDIILEKSGGGPKQPVGRVIIFDKQDGDFSFSNFTSAIRIKNGGNLDFKFLHNFLFFSYISGITESMQSHSTGIRNLDSKLYKEIEIPLPPLPEQHRIVKILDEVFEKTAKAKANAEKNLQNAKELFESYLQSVFVHSGGGWKEKKVGEICEIVNGGTPDTKVPKYWDGDNLWITPKDMGKLNDIYVNNTIRKISNLGLKNSSAKLLPINSVILSSRAPIGHLAINKKEMATNQGCKGLVPCDKLETLFLFYFLKSSVKLLNSLGSGTTFKELSGTKLAKVIIFLPNLLKQKAIVARLDALSAKTKKLEAIYKQKVSDLEELKKSVLKSAFNGNL